MYCTSLSNHCLFELEVCVEERAFYCSFSNLFSSPISLVSFLSVCPSVCPSVCLSVCLSPGKYSLWKDVVVALSVSLCVVGVAYALRQRRVTQQRIDTFLESFREKERELRALHEK